MENQKEYSYCNSCSKWHSDYDDDCLAKLDNINDRKNGK